jgi:hypothetical protein
MKLNLYCNKSISAAKNEKPPHTRVGCLAPGHYFGPLRPAIA